MCYENGKTNHVVWKWTYGCGLDTERAARKIIYLLLMQSVMCYHVLHCACVGVHVVHMCGCACCAYVWVCMLCICVGVHVVHMCGCACCAYVWVCMLCICVGVHVVHMCGCACCAYVWVCMLCICVGVYVVQ